MRRLLPTVERTILVELLLNLVLVTGVVTGVFFIVSVLQFMIRHADLPMETIFAVLPHLLLALFNWTVPSSLLLATIMTYGRMGEDQEVTALRACGVPLYHVLLPAIFVGVLASGLSFALSNDVIPRSLAAQNNMGRNILAIISGRLEGARSNSYVFERVKIAWERIEDGDLIGLTLVETPERKDGRGLGQRILEADRGRISLDADAEFIVFDLHGVRDTSYDAEGRASPPSEAGRIEFRVSASEFGRRGRRYRSTELPLRDLSYAVKRGGLQRIRSKSILMEYHTRLALSFAPLMMVIVGAPIGVLVGRGGVVTAFLVAFLFGGMPFYVMLLGFRALASMGTLHAGFIWIADGAILIFGIFLCRKAIRG